MNGNEGSGRGTQRAWSVAVTLTVIAIATGWAALHRGPWYDEFYTQYVTRAGVPWGEALTGSWLADNHPPFFYMLMRATAWLGEIETHRLVNLAVGAAAAAGAWIMVRDEPRLHAAGAALAMLLAANPWTIHSGSELRSYFVSLCAGALLALSLASLWLVQQCGRRARQAVYALTALVAFNTHIVTTLICGALTVPFVATALLRRDWVRLRALLPAPVAAGAIFVVVMCFQFPHWDQNTRVFWLPAGFDAARWAMAFAVERTLMANPLLLLAGAAGGTLLLVEAWRHRSLEGPLAAALLGAAGIALGFVLLLGIHLIRPIVIEKYLTAAVGALAVIMAIGCSRLLQALPRRVEGLLLLAAFAVSCHALYANMREAAARTTWLGTARLIAQVAERCPQTTIHTDDFWNADVMAMPPRENRFVAPWAYRLVAGRLGFSIATAESRQLSPTCPNLFWAEHDSTRRFTAAAILRHLQESGFAVRRIALYHVGDGWVASDRPLDVVIPLAGS